MNSPSHGQAEAVLANCPGLTAIEQDDVRQLLDSDLPDADICRLADRGDPVADTVFYSWPPARRQSAAGAVDRQWAQDWEAGSPDR